MSGEEGEGENSKGNHDKEKEVLRESWKRESNIILNIEGRRQDYLEKDRKASRREPVAQGGQ